MKVQTPIYMDNHATTPGIRGCWRQSPIFTEKFGNEATELRLRLESEPPSITARVQVAKLIGALSPSEIVFTAARRSPDNLAIKGVAEASRLKAIIS